MKKLTYIFAAAAATAIAMSICSCTKVVENDEPVKEEEPVQEEEREYVYTFSISGEDSETKALLEGNVIAWEGNDYIGDIVGSYIGKSQILLPAPGVEDPRVTFKIYSTQPVAAGDVIYAYHPYSEYTKPASANVQLQIPVEQTTNPTGSFDCKAMPMAALPFVMPEGAEDAGADHIVGDMKFCNLGSVVKFNIKTSISAYADELIRSVSLTADDAIAGTLDKIDLKKVSADNTGTLKISGMTETTVTSYVSMDHEMRPGTDGNNPAVYMVVAPGEHSGTITITTSRATYEYTLPARTFDRSGIRSFTLDLGKQGARKGEIQEYPYVLFDAEYDIADGKNSPITKNGITIAVGGSGSIANNGEDYRIYKSSSLTVSSSGYIIGGIDFCCPVEGEEQYGPGNFTLDCGSYAYDGTKGYWRSGDLRTDHVTFSTDAENAHQVRILSMKVYYAPKNQYNVTIAGNIEHGSISASASSCLEGNEVTLTATPDRDYVLGGWEVARSDNGELINVTNNNTFTMPPCDVTVSATFNAGVTLYFNKAATEWGISNTKGNDTADFTNGTHTITLAGDGTNGYAANSGYLIMGKQGAYLKLPVFSFAVTKITVYGKSGASPSVEQNIFVDDTPVSTATTGATGMNVYEIDKDHRQVGTRYTLKVLSAHNTQITKIEITNGGGGSNEGNEEEDW